MGPGACYSSSSITAPVDNYSGNTVIQICLPQGEVSYFFYSDCTLYSIAQSARGSLDKPQPMRHILLLGINVHCAPKYFFGLIVLLKSVRGHQQFTANVHVVNAVSA